MSTAQQPAQTFTLVVNFTGLNLYLFKADKTRLSIVMPDGRLNSPRQEAEKAPALVHLDGDRAAAHVGYLAFDLCHVDVGGKPFSQLTDPPSEVVRKFNNELLKIGDVDDNTGITGEIRVPNFDEFAPVMRPRSSLLTADPGLEVLAVCSLGGGELIGFDDERNRSMTRTLPNAQGHASNATKLYAHTIQWKKQIAADSLELTITRFDGTKSEKILLRPVDFGGNPTITLRIANLCADNPLEWDQYETPPQPAGDADFKWLQRLFEVKNGETAPTLNLAQQIPVPSRLVPPQFQGVIANCFGGTSSI